MGEHGGDDEGDDRDAAADEDEDGGGDEVEDEDENGDEDEDENEDGNENQDEDEDEDEDYDEDKDEQLGLKHCFAALCRRPRTRPCQPRTWFCHGALPQALPGPRRRLCQGSKTSQTMTASMVCSWDWVACASLSLASAEDQAISAHGVYVVTSSLRPQLLLPASTMTSIISLTLLIVISRKGKHRCCTSSILVWSTC